MSEVLDIWNELKKEISRKNGPFCKQREIWWCCIGMNIGTEIYGKNEFFERPVIIFKVYSSDSALIIPLTSNVKYGKYFFSVRYGDVISSAILSQSRVISAKRLSRKIGTLPESQFIKLREKYIENL